MTWTSVKTNRYIREDMTFLPQWLKVWHLYSKFLKRLQIYFLNQISNYCMHSKLKLTTWHLINKDFLKWINSFSDFSSVVQSCLTLYEPMYCSMPGLPVHHQLPEFTQTHVHWGNNVIPFHPLSSPSSPPFTLSQHQGLFQWVHSWHQVAKYWISSFNISPSNEYSGLISFRMDWVDLLAIQGTLKSLLQHHSSKASILWCSAFFIVQLSHPYMTTGKTIASTRWSLPSKISSVGPDWIDNLSNFKFISPKYRSTLLAFQLFFDDLVDTALATEFLVLSICIEISPIIHLKLVSINCFNFFFMLHL